MSALTALLIFLISFMLFTILLKLSVSYALGASSILVILYAGIQISIIPQFAFSGIDSFSFLAIPFYIFAGVIMEYSGISKVLIGWIKSFVGKVRGSTGVITIFTCMAFGVLTGSAMATISAIGKMMIPELKKDKYPNGYISALLAATCFLGILIPPSVPGIMYSLASGTKISEIWMATIVPAIIFAVGYCIVNYFCIARNQEKKSSKEINLKLKAGELFKSTILAFPALLMPIVIYGAIYGGFCTVTEAGAVSCMYGIAYYLVIRYIIKKDVKVTFFKMCAIAGGSTAVIGLLNAFSQVAGKVMTIVGMSNFLSNLIISNISTRFGFLLMINLLFLFMGTFMDINATILIMTPLLLPVAQNYGVTALHFGTIMIVNMCVGFLTPPFAVGIFVSSKLSDASFGDTVRAAVPFMIVGLIAIVVTSAFPGVVTLFI